MLADGWEGGTGAGSTPAEQKLGLTRRVGPFSRGRVVSANTFPLPPFILSHQPAGMSYDTNPPLIPLDTPHDLVRIQASFHAAMLEVLGPKLAGVADPVERAAIQAELEEVRSCPLHRLTTAN